MGVLDVGPNRGEPIIDDSPNSSVYAFPDAVRTGLLPRDYLETPRDTFQALPSEMKIIPKSEWHDRIIEQEKNKARLSDIRNIGMGGQPIPHLDQDGVGYSHDDKTEVLTEKGWVRWPDWNHTDLLGTINPDTHRLEFQAPTEWHASEYKGETYHSTNRRIDFGVTNYHRMYVRPWDESRRTLSDDYTFQNADSLGWYFGLLTAPSGFVGTEMIELSPEGCPQSYRGDDLIALMALVVSDGFAGGAEKNRDVVSFCCFDERRPVVAALAHRVGFREKASCPGVWNKTDPALAVWVRQHCYTSPALRAENKKVPDFIKWASSRQIKLFLSWFGDRDRNRDHYYSASKRLIDDLQELFLRIGRRGAITRRDPRQAVYQTTGQLIVSKESWELHVSETDRLSIERKKHMETDRYNGLVYCATVPNGILVTRRNGSVLISGNCWAHSTAHATMIARAVQNETYVPLSAFAVASIIKNGRDEGGWCGLSAKFLREVGIPDQKLWPQGSRNLKYDTPEMRANAAKYKVVEDWVDLTVNVYDQNLTFAQLVTCLLMGCPCAVDFNWWGHSVCALDVVEVEAGSFGLRILNSWKGWGDNGCGILRGQKAIPDGAVSFRMIAPSQRPVRRRRKKAA